MPIRIARGDGVLLDRVVAPFHDRLARPATAAEVRAWLAAAAPRRSHLDVGALSLVDDAPFGLDAGGFDRHTFLCGQSGSGKTYSLGLILEQLLLETDLRIVILDPNSDFTRLGEVRPARTRRGGPLAALAPGIAVRSAARAGAPAASAVLRARRAPEGGPAAARPGRRPRGVRRPRRGPTSAAGRLDELDDCGRPRCPRPERRVRNLGVQWPGVWTARTTPARARLARRPRVRCLVVDLGTLPTREEQALVAESVLRASGTAAPTAARCWS